MLSSTTNLNELSYFHPITDFSKKVNVTVVSVYDGDTCTLVFRLFDDPKQPLVKFKARLFGIDTPEMKGGTAETKALAIKARDFVREKTLGKSSGISCLFKPDCDKYGRLLVELFDEHGICINDDLVVNGLAKKYDGGTKESWVE